MDVGYGMLKSRVGLIWPANECTVAPAILSISVAMAPTCQFPLPS